MARTVQELGTTQSAQTTAQIEQAAIPPTSHRGRAESATPAAAASGNANRVRPRNRSSVVRAPKGASQSSFR